MKKTFKDVYPSMSEADNGRKKKKMATIIMKYEQDIEDYINAWATKTYRKRQQKSSGMRQQPISP